MIIAADDRGVPPEKELSPQAAELEARGRDIVTTLTDANAAPRSSPRPWHRGGQGWAWSWLAFGLLLVFATLALFEVLDDDGRGASGHAADPAEDASSPSPPPAGRWHFTAADGAAGLYTIDLLGDGRSGPIDVLEDATDVGTYAWSESGLTIEFTRVLTMLDGFEVVEPSSFLCIGTPDMDSLACTYERQTWTYVPGTGVAVDGTSSAPTQGTRQG